MIRQAFEATKTDVELESHLGRYLDPVVDAKWVGFQQGWVSAYMRINECINVNQMLASPASQKALAELQEELKNKDTARAFLLSLGMITETGELSQKYGGDLMNKADKSVNKSSVKILNSNPLCRFCNGCGMLCINNISVPCMCVTKNSMARPKLTSKVTLKVNIDPDMGSKISPIEDSLYELHSNIKTANDVLAILAERLIPVRISGERESELATEAVVASPVQHSINIAIGDLKDLVSHIQHLLSTLAC